MIKFLLNNFWLKLIALMMGALVWLHVATEKTYNHRITLPVTEISLKNSLTLSVLPPDSLYVEVSASGKNLLREKWKRFGIRINATQFRVGRHTLSLTTSNTSLASVLADISLEEILTPRQIQLEIDNLSSKEMPVRPNIEAEADDGFAISQITVRSPELVTLSGPRRHLHSFTSLKTATKHLSSLRTNVTLRLPVELPEGYGYSVRPDSVTVEVEVVPAKTRVYDDLPIVILNSPVGQNASTEPATIRVELTGPPQDIDLLNRNALTVFVDYKKVSDNSFAEVKIDCPSRFSVKRSSVDSARIILENNARLGN